MPPSFLIENKISILFSIKLLFSFLLLSIPVLVCKGWKAVVEVVMNETWLAYGKGLWVGSCSILEASRIKDLDLQSQGKLFAVFLSSFYLSPFMGNDRNFIKTHRFSEFITISFPTYLRVFNLLLLLAFCMDFLFKLFS